MNRLGRRYHTFQIYQKEGGGGREGEREEREGEQLLGSQGRSWIKILAFGAVSYKSNYSQVLSTARAATKSDKSHANPFYILTTAF